MTDFADHFSHIAPAYASHRPHYPEALFAWLAGLPSRRQLAWDCGTGNGQAALGLARHFPRVIATDASEHQLEAATAHPAVEYRRAPAEASVLPAGSVDLVTVAQALHWFDIPSFFQEVRRVLAPGGALAVWTYRGATLDDATATQDIETFMLETLGPYWAPARVLVNEGYRTIPFPFTELETPSFVMAADWSLDDLVGYVATWSAVSRFRDAVGRDPMPDLERRLAAWWGPGVRHRRVTWRLSLRVGKVSP